MAIKSKAQTPDFQAMFAAFMAQQANPGLSAAVAAQAPKQGGWRFDILHQDGTAALVMAHTPKGESYKALATVRPNGYVKLGPNVNDASVAKAFARLLSLVQ